MRWEGEGKGWFNTLPSLSSLGFLTLNTHPTLGGGGGGGGEGGGEREPPPALSVV